MAASLQVSLVLSAIFLGCFLASPAYSLTCTSQKFNKGQGFTNCTDLPQLKSYLHYTYNATNKTLSIAFIASPPKPQGWVSYAINPNASLKANDPMMVGAQALVAFKDTKSGAVTVKTYNLISYKSINETKLSFDVWDLSAEENKGQITIFAKLKVPAKVNQLWQVGSEVMEGMPMKHAFDKENLESKSTLELTAEAAAAPTPAPAPEGDHHSGDGRVKMSNGVPFLVLLPLLVASLSFF